MKLWASVAIAALVMSGAAYGVNKWQREEECPGHWHSSFLVFMNGNQVHFRAPVFLRGPQGIKNYDLHSDDQIMHYHPQFRREQCTPISAFLLNLGIQLGTHHIEFNENFGANAGTYRENATHSLQVHLKPWGKEWREVEWKNIDQRQMRPGERLLITYGELTPELIDGQKALVREVPDHYLPLELRADKQAEVPDEHATNTTTSA